MLKPTVGLKPARVIFRGPAGESMEQVVEITPTKDLPFKIKSVNALRGVDISYDLKEKEVKGEKKYLLVVKCIKTTPGRIYDNIYVKTDSSVVKTIQIPVVGDLKAPVKKTGEKEHAG